MSKLVKINKNKNKIKLTLTLREAILLRNLTGDIAGSVEDNPLREQVNSIYHKLDFMPDYELGIPKITLMKMDENSIKEAELELIELLQND